MNKTESINDTDGTSVKFSLTESFSHPLLLWPCVAFAGWDAITTATGTMAALGGNRLVSFIAAFVVTLFVTAVLFRAFHLLKSSNSTTIGTLMRILIVAVIVYDLFTSYYGAKFATYSGDSGQTELLEYEMGFIKGVVVFMLTGLSVGATLICSRLLFERDERNLDK